MLSPKFERVKERHVGVAGLLDRLGHYIESQQASGQPYVIPKLAAAALQLTDGEAFVLLDMLAEGEVLQRVYNVYCRSHNALLATVPTIDALDDVSHCDFCNCDHAASDLKVEVAFISGSRDQNDVAA